MRTQSVDLTRGTIWTSLLRYSWPLVLSNLLQQLYNTADSMVVGNFAGYRSMASIGATTSLCFMMIGMFTGLATGSSVIVAQAFGEGNSEKIFRAVHTTYATALTGGLILTLLGHFLTPVILTAMGTTPTIMPEAILYARLYFYGAIPMLVYNMGSGILLSVGDSKRPFYYLLTSTIINFILDYILVAWCSLGVLGAGLATFMSQLMVSGWITHTLIRTSATHHLTLGQIRFYKEELKRIFLIGIPAGIQNSLISFSNVLIQSQVNRYGDAAIAGVAAANRYDAFLGVGTQAFVMAATTFTGQNIGARQPERLRKGTRSAVILAFLGSFVVGAFLLIFSKPLLAIFSPEPEVIDFGFRKMRILTPTHWVFSIAMILGGIIRGAGRSLEPMLISLFCLCGLRMVWIFGVTPFWNSIDVVFYSYPVSWTLCLVITLAVFIRKNWLPSDLKDSRI